MSGKVCFKCKIEKDLTEFYKHGQMADGHLGKCKECTKQDVRRRRRDNPSVQEYDRRRFHDNPERRAATTTAARRRMKECPEKYRAHYAVSNAVRDGRLDRPNRCSRCNEKGRIEGHHEDYSKPLEVIWLCTLCHRRYT
jgi:hypothetical protein